METTTQVTVSLDRSCLTCGEPDAPKKCGKCKAARYCDEKCQKSHWEDHKPYCNGFDKPAPSFIQRINQIDTGFLLQLARKKILEEEMDYREAYAFHFSIEKKPPSFIINADYMVFNQKEVEIYFDDSQQDPEMHKRLLQNFVFITRIPNEKTVIRVMPRARYLREMAEFM